MSDLPAVTGTDEPVAHAAQAVPDVAPSSLETGVLTIDGGMARSRVSFVDEIELAAAFTASQGHRLFDEQEWDALAVLLARLKVSELRIVDAEHLLADEPATEREHLAEQLESVGFIRTSAADASTEVWVTER